MKNMVIVDANIALKWILEESDSGVAQALLTEWINKEVALLAPALLAYEIANILHQQVRKGQITVEQAQRALRKILFSELELDFSQNSSLGIRALEFANEYGLPAAYDAHYLALAEREDCELWTADGRMWRAVQGKLPWVRNLSDFQPPIEQNEE
jgi:predicted nucleic acid-binding protein